MIANKNEHLKKELLAALEQSLGIVSHACNMAGVSRTTFYEYCKADPDFMSAVDDIDNLAIDFAESKLLQKIKEGDTTSIIFYLKTKGKKRGYVQGRSVPESTLENVEVPLFLDVNEKVNIPVIKWVEAQNYSDDNN